MPSEGAWHRFGHFFVPKESWLAILEDPGTTSVTVQGKRRSSEESMVRIAIEPSIKIHPGVFINVNEQFNSPYSPDAAAMGTERVLKFAREQWDGFLGYADNVSDHLFQVYR